MNIFQKKIILYAQRGYKDSEVVKDLSGIIGSILGFDETETIEVRSVYVHVIATFVAVSRKDKSFRDELFWASLYKKHAQKTGSDSISIEEMIRYLLSAISRTKLKF